jgi:hypothetical protein
VKTKLKYLFYITVGVCISAPKSGFTTNHFQNETLLKTIGMNVLASRLIALNDKIPHE